MIVLEIGQTWQNNNQINPCDNCDVEYIDAGSHGRANNWACGYVGKSVLEKQKARTTAKRVSNNNLLAKVEWDTSTLEDSSSHRKIDENGSEIGDADEVLERIRKYAEAKDFFDGLLMINSAAGGTGSGLGSRVAEMFKNVYQKKFLITTITRITPFSSGETALQHYNTVLSLSWETRYSDIIFLFENDVAMKCFKNAKKLEGHKDVEKISVNEMNQYIANCLSETILPIWNISGATTNSGTLLKSFNAWEWITDLVPIPQLKFIRSSSSNTRNINEYWSWEDHTSMLVKNMASLSNDGDFSKKVTLASTLMIRGIEKDEFSWYFSKKQKDSSVLVNTYSLGDGTQFRKGSGFLNHKIKSKLGKEVTELKTKISSSNGHDYNKKSLTLIQNSNDIIPLLSTLSNKAETMLSSGAYLHWYERFWQISNSLNSEFEDVLQDSISSLRDVIDGYEELCG
ncbi:hypothetical protein HK096_008648 [Nowakowskiella sp. JEL0078]|nr:hypothetical protein HK096_008648 [Nowakowskiella sp. JEL0078]